MGGTVMLGPVPAARTDVRRDLVVQGRQVRDIASGNGLVDQIELPPPQCREVAHVGLQCLDRESLLGGGLAIASQLLAAEIRHEHLESEAREHGTLLSTARAQAQDSPESLPRQPALGVEDPASISGGAR